MKLQSWKQLGTDLCTGSLAGSLSTIPMTLTMNFLHKYLMFYNRFSPPPKKITLRMARKMKISMPFLKRKKRKLLPFLSHYSYGAATGALYPLWSKKVRMNPMSKGMLHSMMIYVAGYFGWLPAMGLWSPGRESNLRRFTMIVSHLVWGASLGLIHSKLPKATKKFDPFSERTSFEEL